MYRTKRLSQLSRLCLSPSRITPRILPRPYTSAATTFENGTNAYYADEMYKAWRQDPSSVHASWQAYFSGLDKGLPSDQAFRPPPSLADMPAPADGMHHIQMQGDLDVSDHLKVSRTMLSSAGCPLNVI
jgi:2-oxoglutarate dehydrogenase E1 component